MTCYFKHVQHLLKKTGIEVTSANIQEIDRIIHGLVGAEYKNCPATWREVKKRIVVDEERFVSELKEALLGIIVSRSLSIQISVMERPTGRFMREHS